MEVATLNKVRVEEEVSKFKSAAGTEVPIPTLPEAATVNIRAPEEDATVKISAVGAVDVPLTDKVATGEEEFIPNIP